MSDTKLLDLLPPYVRNSALAKALAQAVGQPMDYWRGLVASVGTKLSPDGAPADWLPWLMSVVGLPENESLSEQRKRNLIRRAGEIRKSKGLEAGIEAYVQAVAGLSADVVDLNTHAFIAGVNVAGDVCGPGVLAWQYEIRVPTGSIEESELRHLLEPFVPLFCEYTVVFT